MAKAPEAWHLCCGKGIAYLKVVMRSKFLTLAGVVVAVHLLGVSFP
jgi:hypothetical protein